MLNLKRSYMEDVGRISFRQKILYVMYFAHQTIYAKMEFCLNNTKMCYLKLKKEIQKNYEK